MLHNSIGLLSWTGDQASSKEEGVKVSCKTIIGGWMWKDSIFIVDTSIVFIIQYIIALKVEIKHVLHMHLIHATLW